MSAYDTFKSAILGDPFDSNKKPSRQGAVQAFAEMQVQLEAAQSGALVKDTLSNLQAISEVSEASIMAWVVNDPTQSNNGIYENTGTAVSPSWTRRIDIPQFVIAGINSGSGTPDAIEITTDLPVPSADGRCLITVPILANNTGNLTISINGASPIPVLTSSGNQIGANGLVASMHVMGIISAGNFRLHTDIASAAIITQAEDARDRAEAAEDAASVYAGYRDVSDFSQLVNLSYAGVGPVTSGDFIRTRKEGFNYEVLATGAANFDLDYVGSGGVKLKVVNEVASFKAFGVTGDGITDDAELMNRAISSGIKHLILTPGTYLIGETTDDYLQIGAAQSGLTIEGGGGVLKMRDNTPLSSSTSAIEIDGASDVLINNIRYQGNAPNNTDNTLSSTGIVSFSAARRSQRIIWSNNIVEESNNVGCYVTDGSTECVVADNIFRNCFGGAVRIGLPDGSTICSAVVTGNTAILDDNIHPGVAYQDGLMAARWGGDVIFANNRLIIRSNVTSPPQMLFWLVRARRLMFIGNEVINEGTSGAYGIQGAITDDTEQIIIRGNNFSSGQGLLFTDSGGARTIGQIIVEGNRILSKSQGGIQITTTATLTVNEAIVSNNIVEYNGGQGIKCGAEMGIINGNVVKRIAGTHGIFVAGTNMVVSGNSIELNGDASRGVEIYSTDSIVTGNRISGATGQGMREQGSANWNLIHGNHLKGATITVAGANTVSSNNI